MRIKAKNYINYILDVILLFSILFILMSSYILWFVLPRGIGLHGTPFCIGEGYGGSGNWMTVWSWQRFTWIEIHIWASVALVMVILLHVILHWSWIVETTKRIKSFICKGLRRVIEIYVLAVVLFILFLFELFSGFVIWLFLPRGVLDYYAMISGYGQTFWGLQRNCWVDIHAWIAIIMLSFIIIHVIMHWKWIVCVLRKNNGK